MRYTTLRVIYNPVTLSPPLRCSEDCHDFFMGVWDKGVIDVQEQLYVLFMNGNNQVITLKCFNTGNGTETMFDIKFVLACALGCLAVKIIIAHNHPSGILKASRMDIATTERMAKACQLVDIKLEDHLIICRNGYYSFADNGMI